MKDKETAYLLGAYLRCGRRSDKGRIAFPHPIPPLNKTTYRIDDDLFSKQFTLGPSILWVEEKEFIPDFLRGFFDSMPTNYWRTQHDVHNDIVQKWIESCDIHVVRYSSVYMTWGEVPEVLVTNIKIKKEKRKVFAPTPASLPVLHGIYWCKHTRIDAETAELGPLPEDLFKYVINLLTNQRYRSNNKYIRIRTTSLDPPGLPKPQCLSTPEDFKDFVVGWYEGDPPELIVNSVEPFNKREWLNERIRTNKRIAETSSGNTDSDPH